MIKTHIPSQLRYVALLTLLTVCYFLAAKLGLLLSFVGGNVSAIWPPTGIALAVLVRYGWQWTPAIFCGAFWVTASTGVPLLVALGIASGNTLEAVIGTWLLQCVRFQPQLGHIRDVISWSVLAAFISPLFSASIGAASLALGGVAPWLAYWNIWWVWWIGDAMGALIIGSLLLVITSSNQQYWRCFRQDWAECLVILLLLLISTWSVFSLNLPLPDQRYPLAYIVFPFVIWAALRFRQLGAMFGILVVCSLAIWNTINGAGPFVRVDDTVASLVLLMAYMLVITITALLMAASSHEQVSTQNRLALAQHVLDKATVGILWFNAQGRCVYANDAICDLLNTPRHQLLTQYVWQLTKTVGSVPKHWPADIWQNLHHEHNIFETVYLRNNAPPVAVEVSANLLHFGEQEYICTFIRDISARQQAESHLRKLSRAVEQTANAIIITNLEGEIEFVNPAFTRITGYSESEVMGRSPSVLKSGKHSNAFYRQLWQTIKNGQVWQGEFYNRHRTGNYFWDSTTISPVRDAANDQITHYLAVKEDISERKRTEQALATAKEAAEVANRAKSRFIANMSHELRTPLNVILGYSKLLARDTVFSSQQHQFLVSIQNSGEHLLSIFNDILDLSRAETGRLELVLAPFNTALFFHNLVEILRISTTDKKLSLQTSISSNIPVSLVGDSARLRQVVLNLTSNAIKFTEQGNISLKVTYKTPHLVIQIADTGMGIAPELQSIIFQPFQQDCTDYYKPEGTGLGLAITQHLVNLMQGELNVRSKLEMGSQFTVRIPLAEAQNDLYTHNTVQPVYESIVGYRNNQSLQTTPYRMLISKSERHTRQALRHALQPLGFEIFEAEDGQQCLDKSLVEYPDVIILDTVLPKLDGLQVARTLRQYSQFAHTVIILTAVSAELQECSQALAAGCNALVSKPIDIGELLKILQHHLQLTWLYRTPEQNTVDPTLNAGRDNTTSVVEIPEELHDLLLSAVKRGHIDDTRQVLKTIEQQAPTASLFPQLQDCAKRFDLRSMRQLLEQKTTTS